MFNLKRLVDYIKRKNLRLKVRLPVYFCMPDKGNPDIESRKCFTSDISLGGISISNLQMPAKKSKHLLHRKIYLQFRLPLKKRTIDATGLIEWDRVRTKKEIADNHMGVKFLQIRHHDILDLLSYGLNLAQFRLGAMLLAVVLIVAAGYGITAASLNHGKQVIKEQLVNSESRRRMIVREVDELLAKKARFEAELKANELRIEKQKVLLENQETAIAEQKDRIDVMVSIIQLVSEEWDVDVDSSTIIDDESFRYGRNALKKRNFDEAVSTFQEVLKTYPDSPLVYKMLYKALYRSGKTDDAEKVYQKYIELLKKDIIKGG